MEKVIFSNNYQQSLVDVLKTELNARRILIISDEIVADYYLAATITGLKVLQREILTFIVPVGEQSKSISVYENIMLFLAENHFDRGDLIISLGGGVVGDLAGFIASTYKRGIKIIQIPTSFTAQVDSSVGSKTALNLGNSKNVIGTFYAPLATIIDGTFLDTLSERNLIEGYVEAVKMSLLAGNEFAALTATVKTPQAILDKRDALIKYSVAYKQSLVTADLHDHGVRKFLNFGHTIGHAIELTDANLMHGEAIAIGMVQLAKLMMSEEVLKEIVDRLISFDLALDSPLIGTSEFINNMKNDKKIAGKKIDLVLLDAVGKPRIQTVSLQTFKQK